MPYLSDRLRRPDGCPWDREQTHASLRKHLLEEAYEVYDALEGGPTPELAGIPTMIELGYKDVEYYIWAGLFAPKGTPASVMQRLRDAMREVMVDPKVTSVFTTAGSPPAYLDQPEFTKFVEADAKRLIPVVRRIGRLDEKAG